MADSGIDPQLAGLDLESLDPTPDVHSLFSYYNALYFDNQLGACSVEWSTKRMTLCAGVCHFSRSGGCRIKLSEPLLKFRPVQELKETLLHEMIHAALFLGNVRDDGDHGPKFRSIMTRINKAISPDHQRPPGGYNITVYHTMHDEVNNYRTHVWRCTGCGNMVRRSMNRPPQEADCRSFSKAAAAAAPGGTYCKDERCWYHGHIKTCGGVYEKIAEPEKQPPPGKAAGTAGSKPSSKHPNAPNKRRQAAAAAGAPAITSFFPKREAQPAQQVEMQQHGQQQGQQQQLQQQGLSEPVQQQQQERLLQQQTQQQVKQQERQHQQGQSPRQQQQQQQQVVQKQQQQQESHAEQLNKPPDPRAAAAAAALARATGTSSAASAAADAAGTNAGAGSSTQPAAARVGTGQLRQQQSMYQQQQASQAQQQQQRSKQQQPSKPAAEVVDLLSSDDEEEAVPVAAAAAAAAAAVTQPHSRPLDSRTAHPPWLAPAAGAVGAWAVGAVASVLMCPVCCLEFQQLGALNAHLDECLM